MQHRIRQHRIRQDRIRHDRIGTGASRRFEALRDFLHSESSGGVVLILAAVLAVAWANSPLGDAYARLVEWPLGPAGLARPLQEWVNDGLMSLFFLLVGLEIRREITEGELAAPARLAAPALAACGGVALPALIYVAFNFQHPANLRGWAIPVATDIAFSLAVLDLLGARAPMALRVFLTALAIIDDLIAILVIALFYTGRLALPALGAALAVWAGLFALNRMGVRRLAVYLAGGAALWACLLRSGVHPTLAGVALAAVVPAGGPARRLERGLEPWVAYAVLPLFGLSNAGLRFGLLTWGVLRDPVTLGIAAGLVVGKQAGVFGTALAVQRLGLARLPGRLGLAQLYGGALLCGIGFTMSLFIGDLAFRGQAREAELRVAVFAGSLVSAACGACVLAWAGRRQMARR